jgi:hypothetical protein
MFIRITNLTATLLYLQQVNSKIKDVGEMASKTFKNSSSWRDASISQNFPALLHRQTSPIKRAIQLNLSYPPWQ